MSSTIVGIGNVGGALAIALSRVGEPPSMLIVRNRRPIQRITRDLLQTIPVEIWSNVRSIDTEAIIIATGDPDIGSAVLKLLPFLKKGQTVLHTSGSLSSNVLLELRKIGCETGSMHPLVSISDPVAGANSFSEAYFCVEGTRKAVKAGRRFARLLGAVPFTIPVEKKALYHASAVMAAGHVTALFDSGVEMLSLCGMPRHQAARYLHPLIQSTANNLARQMPDSALTGTFARLDVMTFERHLKAMKAMPRDVRRIYLDLAERSVAIMARSKPKDARVREMRRKIFLAKEKSK